MKIRFTQKAWDTILFYRDISGNEFGAFGIAPNDRFTVEEIVPVKQTVTSCTVAFDDDSVSDFFCDMAESGLKPEQYGRIWIHTHPGSSPSPSGTDEETFAKCFGKCDWSVMFNLGRTGKVYSRMNILGYGSFETECEVVSERDFSYEIKQYKQLVTEGKGLYEPIFKTEGYSKTEAGYEGFRDRDRSSREADRAHADEYRYYADCLF